MEVSRYVSERFHHLVEMVYRFKKNKKKRESPGSDTVKNGLLCGCYRVRGDLRGRF